MLPTRRSINLFVMELLPQLQAVALNEGVRRRKGLWSKAGRVQLGSLALAPWATRRREDLLALLDYLEPRIANLTTAIEQEAAPHKGTSDRVSRCDSTDLYRLAP